MFDICELVRPVNAEPARFFNWSAVIFEGSTPPGKVTTVAPAGSVPPAGMVIVEPVEEPEFVEPLGRDDTVEAGGVVTPPAAEQRLSGTAMPTPGTVNGTPVAA